MKSVRRLLVRPKRSTVRSDSNKGGPQRLISGHGPHVRVSCPADKYVSRDGILDYLQALCVEISLRTRRTDPDWCGPAPEQRPAPSLEGKSYIGAPQSRFCTEVPRLHGRGLLFFEA
jgi:hypothetical protein